jgi:large subunit ribosomal protein L24
MLRKKFNIKKDDKIKVLTGKDKDKIGKVLSVKSKSGKIIVEGINVVKRHTKPSMKNAQGGILEKEAPLDRSNIMLMCPKCIKSTRIKMKILENNKKVRVCKKCNEVIDA